MRPHRRRVQATAPDATFPPQVLRTYRGDVRMASAQRQPMGFSQEQIAWLEGMFPEQTTLADPQELARQLGIRHVLNIIRQQSKVEVRYVVRSIPTAG